LNNVFLYSDDDHLNTPGSRQFAEHLKTLLPFASVLAKGQKAAASLSR
jgi:hypothetical protein